jgi:hypothetical protein
LIFNGHKDSQRIVNAMTGRADAKHLTHPVVSREGSPRENTDRTRSVKVDLTRLVSG